MSFGVFVHKFNTKGLLYDDVVSSDDNRLTSRTYVKNTMTGIVDDSLVQVDGSGVAANDFAKFTANGVEGRSYAEVLADLSGQAAAAFSLNSQKITNLAVPTAAADAATKGYVDAAIEGLDVKESVRLASTANVAGSYSSNALTVTSAGVLTIDGGNIAINNRVLLKDQTTGTQNGIYKCSTAGAAASGTSPNTSSAYTGGDASYGSSSSVSGITFTSQTFSGSSYTLQYSNYSGSAVSIGVGDAIIVTAGSDTVAVAASSAHTLNNGGSGTISFSGGGTIAAYSNASSISVTSSSTMAIRALSYGSLISLFPSTVINAAYSSVSLTAAWGGGTIPAGKYIRFRDYSNNAWYYVVSSALSNGDTTLSMAFDSDDSYNTTPSIYDGAATDFAMFEALSGSSAVAAVLTRADDFNSDADITAGAFTFVEEGTASADCGFVLSTNEPITLDSTALGFTQFSSAGVITAGAGITKTLNALSISSGAVTNAMLVNDSVSFGGVSLDLGGTDATPAFDLTNATNYPTSSLVGTITNAQLEGSIVNAKLSNSSVSLGGVSVALGASDATPAFDLSDAANYPTTSLTGTITNAQLAGSIVNAKLVNDSVNFGGVSVDLGAEDLTPAFDLSDATNYPTTSLVGTITNAQLAGSIVNAKLSNSSVSLGGISIALGGTDATPAFDLSDAINYPTTSLDGTITNAQLAGSIVNAKLANSAITIAGASTALGGSITADVIAGQISAATITNAQLAGSIANDKLAGSIAASKLADAPLQDVAGLAVTDGNFIVGDGSNFVAESGATARASLALGSAAGEALTATVETTPSTLPTTVATLKGVYAYDLTSLSAEQSLTLPASYTAGDVGAMVRFKLNSEAIGSGASVKINAGAVSGGGKMLVDGDEFITLDQPYQSVTLCLTKVMSASGASSDELCWSIL